MTEQQSTVLYDEPAAGIARITLNRPQRCNAQDVQLTYELNHAFMHAAHDRDIAVIILRGNGKHFSAGHDLKDITQDQVGRDYPITSTWSDIDTQTVAGWYGWERETYLDMCRRWRDIPKPTIAQVSGACIGGGLMLAWVCDLIVASDDAIFQDPVVNIGANAVEFFAHAWELGPRRAKEMLFTTDTWSAEDAKAWGMVNRVVTRDEIDGTTLSLAEQIASKPRFALKMAKESVNASVDAQGQRQAMDQAFSLHQLCHAQNRQQFGGLLDPSGLPESIRNDPQVSTLVKGKDKT